MDQVTAVVLCIGGGKGLGDLDSPFGDIDGITFFERLVCECSGSSMHVFHADGRVA